MHNLLGLNEVVQVCRELMALIEKRTSDFQLNSTHFGSGMAKLRREYEGQNVSTARTLRIFASGTLFQTHTLELPSQPAASTVVRAHSVEKTRGGSASVLLTMLAQFPGVEAALVAPLGGNDEGNMIINELEGEGVSTRYCKVWKGLGVPSAWVMHAADNDSRTVVNHNPLPDITHEEFVTILGPLLAPENYILPPTESLSVASAPPSPRPSTQSNRIATSPAPFDWIHFEGRSVKSTRDNMSGLHGMAKERKWRSHCVFSVDVGRRGRQGVEALIPHCDVIFVNKHYAQANSPHYATTPRAFLLSLTSIAPPHALLVAYWGAEGAAVLSLPTKEYFQSSGWVEDRAGSRVESHTRMPRARQRDANVDSMATEMSAEIRSVRSGSDFWADGRSRTPSSAAWTAGTPSIAAGTMLSTSPPMSRAPSKSRARSRSRYRAQSEDGFPDETESTRTEVPDTDDGVVDEIGAQDAFVAGMIYALSRQILPGAPFTPSAAGDPTTDGDLGAGRWRLDECLRFATELAGRKARRQHWSGLAAEMLRAGWSVDS